MHDTQHKTPRILRGGATGELVREFPWETTELGPIESWPQSLVAVLNAGLNSRAPFFFRWGPELRIFYNDAYAPLLGRRHPRLLGAKSNEETVGSDVWRVIAPILEEVRRTEKGTWTEAQPLPLTRHGFLEDTYFTWSYSPLYDDEGVFAGILTAAQEVTARVLQDRRMALVHALSAHGARSRNLLETLSLAEHCLASNHDDLVSSHIFLEGVRDNPSPAPEAVRALAQRTLVVGETAPHTAYIPLLPNDDHEAPLGLWIVQLNPRLPFDATYREFLLLAAQQLAATFGAARTESLLAETDAYFRAQVDTSPAMLWLTDVRGSCTYLSKQWYDLTGQTEETGLGFGWLDATHPDDRAAATQAFLSANEARTNFFIKYRLRSRSGEYRWAIDAGNPRYDRDGNYLGFVGTVIDVHDQKLAEAEKQAQMTASAQHLEDMPMPFISFNNRWFVTYMNPAAEEVLQISRTDIVGKLVWEFFPGLLESSFGEAYLRAAREQTRVWIEAYYEGFDRWYQACAYPIRDGLGVGFTDITERKKIDQALQLSEEKFRTYAETMPQMAFIADAQGEVNYYNARFYEFVGRGIEMHGSGWKHVPFTHEEDLPAIILAWETAVRTGHPYQEEFRVRRYDGAFRWHLARALPLRDNEGRITQWLGTITDIHEQKETQESLSKALGVRDEFLSIASHELKTPITSLKLQLQMAKRAVRPELGLMPTPERLAKTLTVATAQVDRLQVLVEDLLDISRIDAGKLSFRFEQVDVVALVQEVVERFSEQSSSAENVFRVRATKSVQIECDRFRTEQVVANLVTNALKYGEGKPVSIVVEPGRDNGVRIAVEDHGIGIAENMLPRVFDRFERAVPHTRISGLGLGLYITKQIVDAHGGHIFVESSLGHGSTFVVELPEHPATTH